MDVHDTGDISRSRPLKEGMVITIGMFYSLFLFIIVTPTCLWAHVQKTNTRLCAFCRHGLILEPGLYIPRDAAYPEKYQGIGIRIEDNVVIGKTVPHVLSVTAPKEIVDIEYCCSSAKSD
jgi:intermediate cleaving peptidase 55